jgi:penicillin-binding protein 1A
MAGRKRKPRERREPVVDPPLRASRAEAGDGGSAPRKRASRSTPPMRRLFYWCAVLGLWALIVAGGAVVYVAANLPPIHSLEIPRRPPSIEIVGTDGKTMATRGEMHGATLTLKEMPPFLPKAFLAIEDHRFYSHFGIDPVGLVRAAAANLSRRGVSQGGSTLTQQLAKNLFLTQERTFARKLQELVLALWLERKFGKTEILELYLNRV